MPRSAFIVFITIVISSLCITDSSSLSRSIKSKYITNCFDLQPNESSEFIGVDGYYESEFMDSVMYNVGYETKFRWDTVRFYYIFYRNKLTALDIQPLDFKDGKWLSLKKNRANLESYLKKVRTNISYAKRFYNDVWGIVRITGDTLNIQSQYNSSWRYNINASESYWKIGNGQLMSIGGRTLGPDKVYPIRWKPTSKRRTINFIPFIDIPPSEGSWLYRKKWARCK